MLENAYVHFNENKIPTHTEDLLWNILLDSLLLAKLKKPRADNKLFEITCPKITKSLWLVYQRKSDHFYLLLSDVILFKIDDL